MAQVNMNAYDADVFIPEFKGLMQAGDHMGTDLRYSPDCMNIETPNGVLQPAPQFNALQLWDYTRWSSEDKLFNMDKSTAMYLNAMVPELELEPNSGSQGSNNGWYFAFKDYYFFFYDGYLYYINTHVDDYDYHTGHEYARRVPTDITPSNNFPSTGWSWCVYSSALTSDKEYYWDRGTAVEQHVTIPSGTVNNELIFSHPDMGVYRYSTLDDKFYKITTPANFAFIARYAERIWGVGTGQNKDSVYYSRAYSSTNWTQNNNHPELGGGEFKEPTWDDDEFVALSTFPDALIAFTRKRAWKITGSDPSNFVIQEQLGNGTKYPNTIARLPDCIIMVGEKGLVRYDGYRVYPIQQEATEELFKRIVTPPYGNKFLMATSIGDKYILSFTNELYGPFVAHSNDSSFQDPPYHITEDHPVESSGYQILILDTKTGNITRMETPKIISFFNLKPCALTYIPGTTPYVGITWMYFDSWDQQRVTNKAVKWVTPWVTFGRQDIKKGGFDFYFTPELRAEKRIIHELLMYSIKTTTPEFLVEEISGPVTFKITIQTEKKSKVKRYTVQPLTAAEISAGKEYKMKRLHFGGSGRRFRVIIEVEAGNTIPWRLIGGIHIIAEIDKD